MKGLQFFISIIVLSLSLSCRSDIDSREIEIKEIDHLKTAELVKRIIENEKKLYLTPSCISEKPRAVHIKNFEDFEPIINIHLDIRDSIHHKVQLESFNKFTITPDLAGDMKIISETEFDVLNKDQASFFDTLNSICKNGYLSISKPVFNETFDLAFVQTAVNCGPLCGGGEVIIYEFNNGNWFVRDKLSGWVY